VPPVPPLDPPLLKDSAAIDLVCAEGRINSFIDIKLYHCSFVKAIWFIVVITD